MSALTDYGPLADFSPQWFVAVPTVSGCDCPTALKVQPQLLALAGTKPWVYAWQMSL